MDSEKLKIAVLGGTGNIGEGMVLRLALQNLMAEGVKNEVIIGSRSREAADEAAKKALSELENCGFDTSETSVTGSSNLEAAQVADVVILTIRFDHVLPLLNEIQEAIENKILITPVVPMVKEGNLFVYKPPEEGSAALAIQKRVPSSTKVVAAFHNIPAGKLRDIVKCKAVHDAIVCSDDEEAKKLVMELTEHMGCLKPLDGGPLKQASTIESLTPLMINLARLNQLKDLGINFS
ncbi:MAG: NADPH-dependent F420 reductase [Methanosarcina flavescens]|uniref:NADPH-dependent F420 reductase n=1 Tax=Methanosarcina flavescens TaxID=1715806 RepID=A0A660HRP0_9EURY|nr:NADPH-dependent F420 reductase [Methanosarcina flavescens]AYK14971.1 NADPH-dependent F420 reductase [Methanosarcina flavescens]NLK32528.1 NADPH-dependent F420 reductase [Methanosarcina flavescens]